MRIAGASSASSSSAVAEDHRQQVVEVVRDAAGEPADRLHLLRLAELLLALAQRVLGAAPLVERVFQGGVGARQVARPVLDTPFERQLQLAQLPIGLLDLLGAPENLILHLAGVCSQRLGALLLLAFLLLQPDELGDILDGVDDVPELPVDHDRRIDRAPVRTSKPPPSESGRRMSYF